MTRAGGVVQRRRAAALAGHSGDVAGAQALVTDPDPTVRSIALGALARLGALTEPVLAQAAHDDDPIVRRRIAELAGVPADTDTPAARINLAALLDDPDSTVVEVAAWAAGERVTSAGAPDVDEAVFDRLIALAREHPAALVREAAVAALGAIGDERGLDAILLGCTDKPAVRRRAVLALAPFDGPAVEAALEQARHDRDWQVRNSAQVLDRYVNE